MAAWQSAQLLIRLHARTLAGATSHQGLLKPSVPPGSVNEYQLRLGGQRQAWLIPLADQMQGVQVIIIIVC